LNAPNESLAPPAEDVIDFAQNELVGKLLHVVVSQLDSLKDPWHLTSEVNQETRIENMRSVITTAVIDAVKIIATERVPAMAVSLGKVEFGADGIKATITLSRSASGRHELADKTGSTVFLQLAEPERFIGGGEKVRGEPDQPKLPLSTGGEEADGDGDESGEGDGESLPEIRPFEDGFVIYQEDMPLAGARKFATHEDAEKHLQEHLGITDFRREPHFERVDAPDAAAYESMKASDLRKLIKERTGKPPTTGATIGELVETLKALDANDGEAAGK